MRNASSVGSGTLPPSTKQVNTKNRRSVVRARKVARQAAPPAPRPVAAARSIPPQARGQLYLIEELYQNLREIPFDSAMAKLFSLRDLIKDNPALRHYHKAIDNMVEGDLVLNELITLLAKE